MKGNPVLNAIRTTIAALALSAAPLALAHPTTEWDDPTQVEVGAPRPTSPREKKEAPRSVERAQPDKPKPAAEPKSDKPNAAADPPRAASR
jgi:hypothetical protein